MAEWTGLLANNFNKKGVSFLMATKSISPLTLPQANNAWYCAVRRLRTWVETRKGTEKYYRPYMLMLIDQQSGAFLKMELLKGQPTPKELQKIIFKACIKPVKSSRTSPHRPEEIHFEELSLAKAMRPLLEEILVKSLNRPQREMVDMIIAEIEEGAFGNEEEALPGLLSQVGVTPAQVGHVFQAAAAFYRAEPWVQLTNDDLLSIQVQPQKEPWYVIVMGWAGIEYGLSIFQSKKELEAFYNAEDPMDSLSDEERHVFFYNEPQFVSFDDLDAIELYRWELSNPEMIPSPIVMTKSTYCRPDAKMLRWYEAVLLAIPPFVKDHLKTHKDGSHESIEVDLKVQTSAGKTGVHIRYPGEDISVHQKRISRFDDNLEEDDSISRTQFRRSMERELDRIVTEIDPDSPKKDVRLKKAQQIMYDAWDEPNRVHRVKMARQALKTSPDCADAYVLLAEDDARTEKQALEYYQAGVDAGRRALGEDFFLDSENIGRFWGILSTRPYMRALSGLGNSQWEMGKGEEAVKIYRELLRLNPNDNQGVRYSLVNLLLKLDQEDELRALLDEYNDYSPTWAYTLTLLAFRRDGDTAEARKLLRKALKVNRHVLAYLIGQKRIPNEIYETISMGGEDEAINYAAAHLNLWRKTPGVVDWLREQTQTRKPRKQT